MNPQHRYERITDDNGNTYVQSSFPSSVSDIFCNLTDPILRADFLRYLVMVEEGGVWADIDVLPHRPISEWVPQSYSSSVNLVIGIENDHHKRPIWPGLPYSVQLAQYTILAKPQHPAFIKLVDRVGAGLQDLLRSKQLDDKKKITFEDVMSTTGPFIFTQVLMEYFTEVTGMEHTGDELDNLQEPRLIGDVLVLPRICFGWLAHEHTHDKDDKSILVEHLFIGSWRGDHPG
ncbi:hypothetical protein DL770_009678 [Monosporascus sp. CRB-9-2]|nr:hypothetical protein DL770_009678 [Monosporascus sp. CRB-9-2]